MSRHYKGNEPQHDVSNNVVCAIKKASDQPAHMRSLIRDFASRVNILKTVKLLEVSKLKWRLHRLVSKCHIVGNHMSHRCSLIIFRV